MVIGEGFLTNLPATSKDYRQFHDILPPSRFYCLPEGGGRAGDFHPCTGYFHQSLTGRRVRLPDHLRHNRQSLQVTIASIFRHRPLCCFRRGSRNAADFAVTPRPEALQQHQRRRRKVNLVNLYGLTNIYWLAELPLYGSLNPFLVCVPIAHMN